MQIRNLHVLAARIKALEEQMALHLKESVQVYTDLATLKTSLDINTKWTKSIFWVMATLGTALTSGAVIALLTYLLRK